MNNVAVTVGVAVFAVASALAPIAAPPPGRLGGHAPTQARVTLACVGSAWVTLSGRRAVPASRADAGCRWWISKHGRASQRGA